MEINVLLTSPDGKTTELTLNTHSHPEGKKTLDDLIAEALRISPDKRKLPVIIHAPNGMETDPSIKMKFTDYGSPLTGAELEAMIITWE